MIKLGYISRQHFRDSFHHALLGTQVGPTFVLLGSRISIGL